MISVTIEKSFNLGLDRKLYYVSMAERNITSIWTTCSFSVVPPCCVSSSWRTSLLTPKKTGIIHWFEIKNPTNTSQKDIKSYFLPCRKSLIAGSPSYHSNMNCKCNRKIVSRDILWSPGLWCSTKPLMLKFSIFCGNFYFNSWYCGFKTLSGLRLL